MYIKIEIGFSKVSRTQWPTSYGFGGYATRHVSTSRHVSNGSAWDAAWNVPTGHATSLGDATVDAATAIRCDWLSCL